MNWAKRTTCYHCGARGGHRKGHKAPATAVGVTGPPRPEPANGAAEQQQRVDRQRRIGEAAAARTEAEMLRRALAESADEYAQSQRGLAPPRDGDSRGAPASVYAAPPAVRAAVMSYAAEPYAAAAPDAYAAGSP